MKSVKFARIGQVLLCVAAAALFSVQVAAQESSQELDGKWMDKRCKRFDIKVDERRLEFIRKMPDNTYRAYSGIMSDGDPFIVEYLPDTTDLPRRYQGSRELTPEDKASIIAAGMRYKAKMQLFNDDEGRGIKVWPAKAQIKLQWENDTSAAEVKKLQWKYRDQPMTLRLDKPAVSLAMDPEAGTLRRGVKEPLRIWIRNESRCLDLEEVVIELNVLYREQSGGVGADSAFSVTAGNDVCSGLNLRTSPNCTFVKLPASGFADATTPANSAKLARIHVLARQLGQIEISASLKSARPLAPAEKPSASALLKVTRNAASQSDLLDPDAIPAGDRDLDNVSSLIAKATQAGDRCAQMKSKPYGMCRKASATLRRVNSIQRSLGQTSGLLRTQRDGLLSNAAANLRNAGQTQDRVDELRNLQILQDSILTVGSALSDIKSFFDFYGPGKIDKLREKLLQENPEKLYNLVNEVSGALDTVRKGVKYDQVSSGRKPSQTEKKISAVAEFATGLTKVGLTFAKLRKEAAKYDGLYNAIKSSVDTRSAVAGPIVAALNMAAKYDKWLRAQRIDKYLRDQSASFKVVSDHKDAMSRINDRIGRVGQTMSRANFASSQLQHCLQQHCIMSAPPVLAPVTLPQSPTMAMRQLNQMMADDASGLKLFK